MVEGDGRGEEASSQGGGLRVWLSWAGKQAHTPCRRAIPPSADAVSLVAALAAAALQLTRSKGVGVRRHSSQGGCNGGVACEHLRGLRAFKAGRGCRQAGSREAGRRAGTQAVLRLCTIQQERFWCLRYSSANPASLSSSSAQQREGRLPSPAQLALSPASIQHPMNCTHRTSPHLSKHQPVLFEAPQLLLAAATPLALLAGAPPSLSLPTSFLPPPTCHVPVTDDGSRQLALTRRHRLACQKAIGAWKGLHRTWGRGA